MPADLLDYPYHFDGRGRTAATDRDDHIRDLIEQVLFTTPGERVMRPEFGSGIAALVFEPNGSTLAATVQMLVQGALQQYLADVIAVAGVEVVNDDSTVRIDVRYIVLADRSTHLASFTGPGSA